MDENVTVLSQEDQTAIRPFRSEWRELPTAIHPRHAFLRAVNFRATISAREGGQAFSTLVDAGQGAVLKSVLHAGGRDARNRGSRKPGGKYDGGRKTAQTESSTAQVGRLFYQQMATAGFRFTFGRKRPAKGRIGLIQGISANHPGPRERALRYRRGKGGFSTDPSFAKGSIGNKVPETSSFWLLIGVFVWRCVPKGFVATVW